MKVECRNETEKSGTKKDPYRSRGPIDDAK